MIGVVLEISLTFVQFFATFASIPDLKVPVEWENPLYYVKIVNLDIPILRAIFPGLDDFRVYFTVVCVLVPLALVFFGLFFLNSAGVLLWYVLVLLGVLLLVAGLLVASLSDYLDLQIDEEASTLMIAVGATLFVVMMAFAMWYRRWKANKDAERAAERAEEERQDQERGEHRARGVLADAMEDETRDFPVVATIQRCVMLIVLAIAGVVFLELLFPFKLGSSDGLKQMQLGLAITFLILAFLILIWTIIACFRGGRQKQWKFFDIMEKQFMRLLLVTMSILYVPVGAGVFVLFNCNEHSCPAGKQFILEDSWMPHNNSVVRGEKDVCVSCYAPAVQNCPAFANVCPGDTRSRLEVDKSIDCDDLVLFNYTAFIVIAIYMIGVPVMFGRLINLAVGLVASEFPVKPPKGVDPEDLEALWPIKTAESNNSARFLYQPFIADLKYTRLIQLIQKLLVVFTAVFVIRISGFDISPVWYALIAGLIIHIISGIWLIVRRPFVHKFENGIAILMEVALLIAMTCALLLFMDIEIPSEVYITVIVMNGVLPIVAIVIAIILEWTSKKSREEEEREEQREAMEAEMLRQVMEAEEASDSKIMSDSTDPHSPHSPSSAGDGDPPSAPLASMVASVLGSVGGSSTRKQLTHEERRQRAIAAREAVEKRRREAEERLLEEQADVDHQINVAVKSQLNIFLMIGGALLCIALGFCVIGVLAGAQSAPTRWDNEDHTVDNELAGYDTWENFTHACCCTSSWRALSDPAESRLVEQWRCSNGHVKERVRVARVDDPFNPGQKIEIDGRSIRSECGMTFTLGCLLVTGGTTETVSSSLGSATASSKNTLMYCGSSVQTDAYSLQYLW